MTPLGSNIPKMEGDGYHCRFSHKDEAARPGYYRVVLQDPKIALILQVQSHGFVLATTAGDKINIPKVNDAYDMETLRDKLAYARKSNPTEPT